MKTVGIVAMLGLAAGFAGPVLAQKAAPEGWLLQEQVMSGINDLTLAWYAPGSGEVLVAISCQGGYSDVVFTAYTDRPKAGTKAATTLALMSGAQHFAMEAISGEMHGRYSVGGITSFQPKLTDLLKGSFTILVDGVEIGRFSTTTAQKEFKRIIAACPPQPARN